MIGHLNTVNTTKASQEPKSKQYSKTWTASRKQRGGWQPGVSQPSLRKLWNVSTATLKWFCFSSFFTVKKLWPNLNHFLSEQLQSLFPVLPTQLNSQSPLPKKFPAHCQISISSYETSGAHAHTFSTEVSPDASERVSAPHLPHTVLHDLVYSPSVSTSMCAPGG